MTKAHFYCVGCLVCVSAKQTLLQHLSANVEIDAVHLGEQPDRVAEAEVADVKSVPTLVINDNVLHINFGTPVETLKQLDSSGSCAGGFPNIQDVGEGNMMKTTEKYRPIDCDLHDYLKITCMYHYWLHTRLTDGTCSDTRALTTCTTAEKEELLIMGQSEDQRRIRLDHLSAVTALMPRATFSTVSFQRAYRGQTV